MVDCDNDRCIGGDDAAVLLLLLGVGGNSPLGNACGDVIMLPVLLPLSAVARARARGVTVVLGGE